MAHLILLGVDRLCMITFSLPQHDVISTRKIVSLEQECDLHILRGKKVKMKHTHDDFACALESVLWRYP